MATDISVPHDPMFTSWKEIASYLGKGVRTVQRWEAKFGLPVRRPHPKSRTICISRGEFDHWLATNWSSQPGKIQNHQLANGVRIDKTVVEVRRELRSKQRQLVSQVERNLQILADRCRALSLNITSCQPVPTTNWMRAGVMQDESASDRKS